VAEALAWVGRQGMVIPEAVAAELVLKPLQPGRVDPIRRIKGMRAEMEIIVFHQGKAAAAVAVHPKPVPMLHLGRLEKAGTALILQSRELQRQEVAAAAAVPAGILAEYLV
jgi:hypothetical protein